MQKNSKNGHENRKNLFFFETTLKVLVYVQQHYLRCFWTNSRPRSLKKEIGQFFTKISDPGYAKKFKKS